MDRSTYFYTESEDKILLEIYKDFVATKIDVTFEEVAERAHSYGLYTKRDIESLAQHISNLINPEEDDAECLDADPELIYFQNRFLLLIEKYEDLLKILIDTADEVNMKGDLKLKSNKISNWLKSNEPERYFKRVLEVNSGDDVSDDGE